MKKTFSDTVSSKSFIVVLVYLIFLLQVNICHSKPFTSFIFAYNLSSSSSSLSMTTLIIMFNFFSVTYLTFYLSIISFVCVFKEKMSSSMASSSNTSIVRSIVLRVVEVETSVENRRKFTRYRVSVNYNGQEWYVWRRYKEFHALNEKATINFILIH